MEGKALRCPFCKKADLDAWERTATSTTLICHPCGKIITAKTHLGKVLEIVVPGVGIIAGTTAIAKFLSIGTLADLADFFDPPA